MTSPRRRREAARSDSSRRLRGLCVFQVGAQRGGDHPGTLAGDLRGTVGDLGAQLRVVVDEPAADPGAPGELGDAGRLAGGHRVECGAHPRRLDLGVGPAQPGQVIARVRHGWILLWRRVR